MKSTCKSTYIRAKLRRIANQEHPEWMQHRCGEEAEHSPSSRVPLQGRSPDRLGEALLDQYDMFIPGNPAVVTKLEVDALVVSALLSAMGRLKCDGERSRRQTRSGFRRAIVSA